MGPTPSSNSSSPRRGIAWYGIASHHHHVVYLAPTHLLSPISAINILVHPPTNPLDSRTFLFLVFCNIFCKLFFNQLGVLQLITPSIPQC
jgi:hypothetical protein